MSLDLGTAHGRAVGSLPLPGGLQRALCACPAGINGHPAAGQTVQTWGTLFVLSISVTRLS